MSDRSETSPAEGVTEEAVTGATGRAATEQGAMPSEEKVLSIIVAIAREHLDDTRAFDDVPADLPAQRLVADLGLDSVQLLTLAMEVENHFEITLDDVDPLAEDEADQAVETVADLVQAVRSALWGQLRSGAGRGGAD